MALVVPSSGVSFATPLQALTCLPGSCTTRRYVTNGLNSVANAFAYYGLTKLADIAGYIGRPADQAKHAKRAEALKQAITKHMWNGTAYCDGPCEWGRPRSAPPA